MKTLDKKKIIIIDKDLNHAKNLKRLIRHHSSHIIKTFDNAENTFRFIERFNFEATHIIVNNKLKKYDAFEFLDLYEEQYVKGTSPTVYITFREYNKRMEELIQRVPNFVRLIKKPILSQPFFYQSAIQNEF